MHPTAERSDGYSDLVNRYGPADVRELPDGRIRYYDYVKPANNPGRTAGARVVREWVPSTGKKRTWIESLNQNGRIIQVRPENGGPHVHYMFDDQGNYTGKW